MPHPVEQKLASLRRRLRLLLVAYAACFVTAVSVAAVGLVALCDWVFRFEDPGLRVIASLAVGGALAWAVVRFVFGVATARLGDVELAQRVERRFPGLNDRLASTVEFLKQRENEPHAGSAQLRRAVVTQTEVEVASLDVADVIDRWPVVRAALVAAAVVAVFGALALLDPSSTRIALTRIAQPLGGARWPQQQHLAFHEPVRRVALGQTFEVELIDVRGRPLPEEVTIQYRHTTGDPDAAVENQPMLRIGDVMTARREGISRPFAYRAFGGDDNSMPWIEVEVVEPPRIEELAIEIEPPDYTGWPPAASEKHIRALVGSRIEVRGRSTKPLTGAAVHIEGGDKIPAEVAEDGHHFTIPASDHGDWSVERSGAYWFELVGDDGLVGEANVRYELRAVPDGVPSVSIEEPTANIYVTADAVVPLRIVAKDDLALRDVTLRYGTSPELINAPHRSAEIPQPPELTLDASADGKPAADEAAVELFRGPDQMPQGATHELLTVTRGDSRIIEYDWDVAELNLRPGDQLTFHVTASDYVPQTGQSSPRRLSIITSAELEDRLAQRQSLVLGELARVLKMQRDARTRTTALEIQLDEVGQLNQRDVDQLQAAELSQRQVARSLTGDSEGVRVQIDGLLADLTNNKIDGGEIRAKMSQIADEIDRLGSDHLPVIARELTSSLKRAQTALRDAAPAGEDEDLNRSLAEAGDHQDAVIGSLEQMLAELTEWDQLRRVQRDLAGLERDQENLARETTEEARRTVARPLADLTPQEVANLKKLTQAQRELAQRFDALAARMRQTQSQLSQGDPLAAETVGDALNHARRQGLSGQMQQAAEQIAGNQAGQAVERQQQIAREIREMLDILANRREHELDRLVKKLREAEGELAELRERQEGLKKRFREAEQIEDEEQRRRELERLQRQQRELEEEARRFARRLERLQAEQAGRSTARAAGNMSRAGQQAGGDQGGASDAAGQAERDLDEAQQQLAERRRQAEFDLAVEQLERMRDNLVSLHDRQGRVIGETRRLDQKQQAQGRLTRGEAISLRDLARQQLGLADETRTVAEKIAPVRGFQIALEGAAERMDQAARHLTEQQTGAEAQASEQGALERLALVLAALEPEKPRDGGQQDGGGGEGGAGGQPPGDAIPDVVHLKLIKLLQVEFAQRTEQLEAELSGVEEPSRDQERRIAMLSEEQGRLADVVRNLIEASEPDPENDPDSLPDFAPDELDLDDALRLRLAPPDEEDLP